MKNSDTVIDFIKKGGFLKASIGTSGDCGNFALALYYHLKSIPNIFGIFDNIDILPDHIILKHRGFFVDSSGIIKDTKQSQEDLFSYWCFLDIDRKFCKVNRCDLMTDEEFYKCVNPRLVKLDTISLRKFIPIVNKRVKLLQKLFKRIIKDKKINLDDYAFTSKDSHEHFKIEELF